MLNACMSLCSGDLCLFTILVVHFFADHVFFFSCSLFIFGIMSHIVAINHPVSVATAQADIFAILGNKIVKNLKIFVEIDYLRSQGVLCQP